MKPIRLSGHALQQLRPRGCTLAEIEEAIRTVPWQPAELNRLECTKDYAFNRVWNGKFYSTKRVRPIFVEKATEIIVVTVYTYYFKGEQK